MDFFNDHAVPLRSSARASPSVSGSTSPTAWLMRQPAGTERMQEIARAVQEGAAAYLRRQYMTIAGVAARPFLVIGFYGKARLGDGDRLRNRCHSLRRRGLHRHERRRALERAHGRGRQSGLRPALNVAFRAGSVTGLLVVGLGLFGVAGYYGFLTTSSTTARSRRSTI